MKEEFSPTDVVKRVRQRNKALFGYETVNELVAADKHWWKKNTLPEDSETFKYSRFNHFKNVVISPFE